MRLVRRVILILLPVLLLGCLLLHPLSRFTLDLYAKRFDRAEQVYVVRLSGSEKLDRAAQAQLKAYVDRQLSEYYDQKMSYNEIMAILTPLSQTRLPQEDMDRAMEAVNRMDAARADLAAADACLASENYLEAVPLYRQALMADESAALRLTRAEALCKNQTLDRAEAAMDSAQYEYAETVLLAGLTVLTGDRDLTAALEDARRLRDDAARDSLLTEARRLLREEGAEASFRYVADLRRQAPEDYALEYMEQLIRHEYEDDICAAALNLQAEGDPDAACALLTEGLLWIDSARIRATMDQIRAAIPYLLGDMPLLSDDTGNPRTGADSTVARDAYTVDSLMNGYANSFCADRGQVTVALDGAFAAFTGTVACPLGEMSDLYRTSATLQIYGDGTLLTEFRSMDPASAPRPFSLPVTGVRELTLRWISEGANGWQDWGRFATVFDGRFLTVLPS